MMLWYLLAIRLVAPVWSAAPIAFPDEMAPALTRAVSARLPRGARVVLTGLHFSGNVPRNCSVRVETEPPVGLVTFLLEWQETGTPRKVFATATSKVWAPVAVTLRPVRHGEGLTQENTLLEEREIGPYLQAGYFADWRSLEKTQARGYLRPRTVLTAANTQVPPLISTGQVAELTLREHGLFIGAQVKALENGDRNQWIRVVNPSTKKTLTARVTGSGTLSLR